MVLFKGWSIDVGASYYNYWGSSESLEVGWVGQLRARGGGWKLEKNAETSIMAEPLPFNSVNVTLLIFGLPS